MKAMIFAAGLGTRLRPLTNELPKALVPINGIPLLEMAVRRLIRYGCREIILNVHHFGEKIIDFLAARQNFGIHIEVSDERGELLDTGGGLKKAAWFLADAPFLLLNADVVTDLDLGAFYQQHLASGAVATLAVRQRPSTRQLLFDAHHQLCGWRNTATAQLREVRPPQGELQPWSFSGIQAISPTFLSYLDAEKSVFSIIDTYLTAAPHEIILAYPHDADIWLDVGKIPQLEAAAAVAPQIPLD